MSVKAYEFYYTEFKGWRAREVKLAIIGECMIELSNSDSELYKLNYGGDTAITANKITPARCDKLIAQWLEAQAPASSSSM